MYIYFDTNGTIKEIVNDLPIRNGNNEANKIYCYIEGEPTIDDIWYLQKLPSGELSNEVSFKNSTITKAIPYDAKRDMKYFKDFVQYKFYVFTLNTFLTSQKGLNIATIRIVIDNEIFALGELTFNVQENVIKVDNGITQSQYDYLLLAYASRTLNEVVGDDLDNLLDDKINAKLGDLADGSPKLFETENEIENEHADYGIAVATDTGYIYVWNDTQQEYQSTGMKYIADVSLFYTKTESDSTFAPKSNAITHTGNQLQDYSGNNVYPNLADGQVTRNKLNSSVTNELDDLESIVFRKSTNLLPIKNYDGTAITDGYVSFDDNTQILTISGTPSANTSFKLYPFPSGSIAYPELKAGTYYLNLSQTLSGYTFQINFQTIKNGTVSTISKYTGNNWEITLSEDTYLFRIQMIILANNTFNFSGHIWLCKDTNKDYELPDTYFSNVLLKSDTIVTDVEDLKNIVYRDSTNILNVKFFDGTAVTQEFANYNYDTKKLTLTGTPTTNVDIKLYPYENGANNYPTLKKGAYFLNLSNALPDYTFQVNVQTIKNGVVTTSLTAYKGQQMEFRLNDETSLYRIQILLLANNTYNYDGYIWLCFNEYSTYENPEEKQNNVVLEKPKTRPTILFSFDAPTVDVRDTLLRQYGFRGTYNFNFEGVGNYGFDAMKTLIQNGHDIGLYRGGDIDSTPAWNGDWDSYISLGLERMKLKGYYLPTVFGCRGLKSNAKINEACKKYNFMFVSSIINQYGDDSYTYYNVVNNTPYTFNICPWAMYDHTLQDNLDKIDEAVTNGYILPLFTHLVADGDGNVSVADFTEILKKVKKYYDDGLLDVLTYREFYNKYHKENGAKRDYDRVMSMVIGDHTPTYNE